MDFGLAHRGPMSVVCGESQIRGGGDDGDLTEELHLENVLYSLHSRSLAFSASPCYFCLPAPRMRRRWLQLVLVEPLLESPRGLVSSPLKPLQLDTEFLNRMIQGKHTPCVPASWSCPLTSDPGPSQSVPLNPPPPSQNQAPGLSPWFPCCPFLDVTAGPEGLCPAKALSAGPCDSGGHGS